MNERSAGPKLVLILSESWTLCEPRALRELVGLAAVAERAGVDGVMVGEHVVLGPGADAKGVPANPRDWLDEENHPLDYPHPSGLHILGAMAAVTSRLRLVAAALITPFRHPLVIAKELATVDLISEGRLIFLPSVSWQREEYAALGVPFDQRGEILDEQLAVFERCWREDPVAHAGKHFQFDPVHFQPKAWRPGGPELWIGGGRLHKAALRRAVRFGSGYFPTVPPPAEDVERLRGALREAGRDPRSFEVGALAGTDTPFPGPDAVKPLAATIESLADDLMAGVTTVFLKPSQFIDEPSQLPDFCREALAMLARLGQDVGGTDRAPRP